MEYENIFDSHAHYDNEEFIADQTELLTALPEKGVRFAANIGVDLDRSKACIALADQFDYMYASVGIHPHDAKGVPADYLEQLAEMSKHKKVVAIGEIGLDFHYNHSEPEKQREVFEAQLKLACELDMPVIIHDREAHAETLDMLKKYRPRGIVHCFSGSAEMAKEVAKLGMYMGFTGVVTFKNARKTLEAAKAVPADKLLIETDCPYMAPEPFRGKRCDSSMLPNTAKALADLRGISVQELLNQTCENACRVYGINL